MVKIAFILFGLAIIATVVGFLELGTHLHTLGYGLALAGALLLIFQMISGRNS